MNVASEVGSCKLEIKCTLWERCLKGGERGLQEPWNGASEERVEQGGKQYECLLEKVETKKNVFDGLRFL